MSPSPPAGPAITVIGDGLAGTVLALGLARRGARVRLIGAARQTATGLSYGALPRGGASRAWRRLEHHHGSLGWRPSGLVVHDERPGLPGALAALSRALPLPLARVDAALWTARREVALAAAGVERLAGHVDGLTARPGGGWRLDWHPEPAVDAAPDPAAAASPPPLEADQVVLAAGAGVRALWPALPPRLRHSWAGVLRLESPTPASPWLEQARRGRIVQPRHWRRPALEAASAAHAEASWIVDAGLAPRGEGLVVGQITLIPAADGSSLLAAGPSLAADGLEPPDPRWMEARLREGLHALDPRLAALDAPYLQVPVSFCVDGQPLVGPVEDAPGLWVFAGFSAAFSRVPTHADALARRLLP
ncbi:MAG: hypothetical protein FJ083_15550 [Cyanobacteria bacterium K_Offshore_surface_m2_239]|nr:hypothetical protein [Cyanobacteria bacterium K_Offshore_surface_m2_239]